MDVEEASKVQPASFSGWVTDASWKIGCFASPIPRSSFCPNCLFFAAVLRFSVGITMWDSTESL